VWFACRAGCILTVARSTTFAFLPDGVGTVCGGTGHRLAGRTAVFAAAHGADVTVRPPEVALLEEAAFVEARALLRRSLVILLEGQVVVRHLGKAGTRHAKLKEKICVLV
jgi:hypothetical protein